MGFLGKIFKSENTRNIDKLEKIAKKVEDLSDKYRALTDEELKGTTKILKDRLANGEKPIDILPDAYACVREASSRVIGKRHYHVQILGGIVESIYADADIHMSGGKVGYISVGSADP